MPHNTKPAGIDANAHLIMKKTIDQKGMLMSMTVTYRCSSSLMIFLMGFWFALMVWWNC